VSSMLVLLSCSRVPDYGRCQRGPSYTGSQRRRHAECRLCRSLSLRVASLQVQAMSANEAVVSPTIGSTAHCQGKFKGKDIGSGTSVWDMSEQVRAGKMTVEEFVEAESCMSRSRGTCMTMGTASTMACMAESLGLSLPGCAAIPAADSRCDCCAVDCALHCSGDACRCARRRNRIAHLSGRRIVEMVKENLTIDKVLTRDAFLNAIRTNAAIGGSTNAVVHLLAIAGRLGVPLSLEVCVYVRDVRCDVMVRVDPGVVCGTSVPAGLGQVR
jgi:dihydroxyacid dehydratase/phosphogluconate dehydratase